MCVQQLLILLLSQCIEAHLNAHKSSQNVLKFFHISTHTYLHTQIHTNMHTNMPMYMHICVCIYVCVYECWYKHVYVLSKCIKTIWRNVANIKYLLDSLFVSVRVCVCVCATYLLWLFLKINYINICIVCTYKICKINL